MNLFGLPNIERMMAERDYDGLYRLLEHNDRQIRLLAAQALAEMGDGAGWRVLMESIDQTSDPETQITAAQMLGDLGHPRAVPALGEMLKKARIGMAAAHPGVIDALRQALEDIGTREAADALNDAGYPPQTFTGSAISASGGMLGVDEYLGGFEAPILPQTDSIQFLTAEEHLNTAVELREAEHAERGLVECGLALWLNPNWPYAWYVRGVLMEDLERNFEAALAYHQALNLDRSQADAREALAELEEGATFPELNLERLLKDLTSPHYLERRDAAAGLGELAVPAAVDGLIKLLEDDEREVRHAAIEALGEICAQSPDHTKRISQALLQREESSWLLRFAILEALSAAGSVDYVTEALDREMNRIQERNAIFTSRKDPLLEVEYDRLMEIGVLALERTADLEGLLEIAEGNTWEEEGEELDEDELDEVYEDSETVLEEEELDAEELLADYVDEVAQMVSFALERLATVNLSSIDPSILVRLAEVPDLTLLDISEDQPEAEPILVHDLSGLRAAAQQELNDRGIVSGV